MEIKKRVLIIDDAVFQSEILREIFQNEFGDQVEVEISREFEDSKSFIEANDFDLILIDYLLAPNVTGVTLKKRLIEEVSTKSKWMLLSALDVSELREKHDEEGFEDFVHKGDYKIVTNAVASILNSN